MLERSRKHRRDLTDELAHKTAAAVRRASNELHNSQRTQLRVPHTTRKHHSSTMTTAKDDTTASKAEDYVLLGDPEKTTALPDLPRTTEPADKRDKTIVADTTARGGDSNEQDKTVEATHAATYEAALKEAAPDAEPGAASGRSFDILLHSSALPQMEPPSKNTSQWCSCWAPANWERSEQLPPAGGPWVKHLDRRARWCLLRTLPEF